MSSKSRSSVRLNLERLEERDVPSSTISGLVFADGNNNGIKDPGEIALAGVTVTLTGVDLHNHAVDLTQVADSIGNFKFGNLLPGVYTLQQSATTGYVAGLTSAGIDGGSATVGSLFNIDLPDFVTDSGNELGELAQTAGWTSSTTDFSKAAIPAGSTLWFSSVFEATGLGTAPVNLHFTSQTITYQLNGTTVTLAVPDSYITLTPSATTSTTTFDDGTNSWQTTFLNTVAGYKFLSGIAVPLPSGLPGGIKNITWQGQLISDTVGVAVNWQWAAAVYSNFGGDYNSLGVKPVDDSVSSPYHDADHVGTPEAYQQYVIAGATGGGGTNYTGTHSGAVSMRPLVLASLSGYVLSPSDDSGIGGIKVYLEDSYGDVLSYAITDDDGSYSFTGLQPGVYQLVAVAKRPAFVGAGEQVGTVKGTTHGTDLGDLTLGDIKLASENIGVGYDFYLNTAGG